MAVNLFLHNPVSILNKRVILRVKQLKVPPISEEHRSDYGSAPFDDPALMPLNSQKKKGEH